MIDEGYIKFHLDWQPGPAPRAPGLQDLIQWRNRLHQEGLIGHYAHLNVGFGNISLRLPAESESATSPESVTLPESITLPDTATSPETAPPPDTGTPTETATPPETATSPETGTPPETATPTETATPPESVIPTGSGSRAKAQFIISGTQTGHIPLTSAEHYSLVHDYDIAANHLTCSGPVKASSESLTHAMFYELDPEIHAVVHIHNRALWDTWKFRAPTTPESVPYGTPEMAAAVREHYLHGNLKAEKLLVMAGHDEGLISFGPDLSTAAATFLNLIA